MSVIYTTGTTAREAFGTPFNRALLGVVAAADILLALALTRPEWVIPVVQYILLAIIMAAAIWLAVIVCDPRQPRQPRQPGPSGTAGAGAATRPGLLAGTSCCCWPQLRSGSFSPTPGSTGTSGRFRPFKYPAGRRACLSRSAPSPPSAVRPSPPARLRLAGASQELVDLVFFSVVVTIALGRIR